MSGLSDDRDAQAERRAIVFPPTHTRSSLAIEDV